MGSFVHMVRPCCLLLHVLLCWSSLDEWSGTLLEELLSYGIHCGIYGAGSSPNVLNEAYMLVDSCTLGLLNRFLLLECPASKCEWPKSSREAPIAS
jgi:hypothetical protein